MGPRPDGRGTLIVWHVALTTDGSFNGAATGWPRNESARCRASPARWRLQWGRDRMAAERLYKSGAICVLECFNGAATGWPRNVTGLLYGGLAAL